MDRLPAATGAADDVTPSLRLVAARAAALLERSPELLLVVDERDRVIAASARARETLGVRSGAVLAEVLARRSGARPVRVAYEAGGSREALVYVPEPPDNPYDELRTAFTAAVSHELRTPLARLLALVETALLPGADVAAIVEEARGEITEMAELVDDVLFLSELETGREVVSLGPTRAAPVLDAVVDGLRESADRAGVALAVDAPPDLELPLRPRMLRVVAQNLAVNAIRYAGPGSSLTFSVARDGSAIVFRATDDGAGVAAEDVPRLFERFYRSDRARASRGTGLGLAIVKHIVTSAGGTVEATSAPGRGLEVRCTFPDR